MVSNLLVCRPRLASVRHITARCGKSRSEGRRNRPAAISSILLRKINLNECRSVYFISRAEQTLRLGSKVSPNYQSRQKTQMGLGRDLQVLTELARKPGARENSSRASCLESVNGSGRVNPSSYSGTLGKTVQTTSS